MKTDTKQIALIGFGYVGKGMHKIFPEAILHDPAQGYDNAVAVNASDLAIICVPTPMKDNGECDTSIVESVIDWLETPLILIKSTIIPGTTEKLRKKYGKRICFSPEYIGEGKYYTPVQYPDPTNPLQHGFMIIGGEGKDCSDIMDIFTPKLGPACRIRIMTSLEAEIVKYAENAWGATKVTFANTLYEICQKLGANWYQVREGWIDDPRVEPMHTAVFPDKRGWGGKCYPKDVNAIYQIGKQAGANVDLLEAIIKTNTYHNEQNM